MNEIRVLFFANFREIAGGKETSFEIPDGINVRDFKKILVDKYPSFSDRLSSVLIAINKDFSFDEDIIPEGAEIAIFPPVSGGIHFPSLFRITEDELDLNSILSAITLPTTGAACFFTGMVRAETSRGETRQTEYLEYEAFVPMAEEKMEQVAREIRERWPSVEGIGIVQRIGVLLPGTPTVLIACTAGHRDTGVFEASRYGIDRLKEIVPIWKKEVGPDREEWIEGEYHPGKGE